MILDEIFEKLGIKGIDELRPEERKVYQRYSEILAKSDTTIEDLKKFFAREAELAKEELKKHENSEKKDTYYKAYLTFTENTLKFIFSPAKERDALRAQLKQQFNL